MKTWKFIVAPTMFPTEMTFNYKAAMKPANTNIARIANAVQVTICLLVSTSVL